MLRRTSMLAAAALAALTIGVPVVDSAGTAAGSKPSLRLVSSSPLRVAGSHFAARERVTLRVRALGDTVETVRATRTGTFAVRFDDVAVDRCAGAVVTARGSAGSRATLKVMPAACPPSQRGEG